MLRMLRRQERGQAMVEVAIAMPILLVVLIGAVQVALVYHARSVTTTAVQEGARFAAAEGRTAAEGEERTRSVLQSGIGSRSETFVILAQESAESVTVSAQGDYPLIIPWCPAFHCRRRPRCERRGSAVGRRWAVPKRWERGTALVELALVLPVLLFMIFGILAAGRVVQAKIAVQAAAREASRTLATAPSEAQGLADSVVTGRSVAEGYGLSPERLTVEANANGFQRDGTASAVVTYSVSLAGLPLLDSAGIVVSSTHTERIDLYRSREVLP